MLSRTFSLMTYAAPRQWFWRLSRVRTAETEVVDDSLRKERFTLAVIGLVAKLAEADGTPKREEMLAFRALFPLKDRGHEKIAQLFARASNAERSAQDYAREIAFLFSGAETLMHELMERLVRIATADAALNQLEITCLQRIGKALGLTRREVKRILSKHQVSVGENPYSVLNVETHISDEALRRVWRQRVRESHPDHLRAQGVQAGHIALAEARLREINAAYDAIQRKRQAS